MHTFLQSQAPKIAGQIAVLRGMRKADVPDAEMAELERIIAGIDFAGWSVLVGDVAPLLGEITADGSYAAFAQINFDVTADREVANVVDADALAYAEARAAEMVGMRRDELGRLVPNPNAVWRIDEGTRDYLRADVGEALTEGWSNAVLAEKIGESYGFSEDRAMMIARTETAKAASEGALNSYVSSGAVDGKYWSTAEDDRVSEECEENANAGIIALEDDFPSGDQAPPVHPNCRCAVVPFIDWAARGAEAETTTNEADE